jgi:radical SAM superfamily enzyme YgiQ (UPF0313 family)
MVRILLVFPSIGDTVFGRMRTLALPPLGLGILASRTPRRHDVTIVDENVEEIDFNADADLVAVSATTVQAPRAYQILAEFRNRGVATVIGGIHASVLPHEAARYADAVVVGEADEIWPRVVEDFARGTLQRVYTVERRPGLEHMPVVDRSLFAGKYALATIQTSRGCPCNCNFCSVTRFNGKRYRFRPVDEVLEEIAGIEETRLFLTDDSIVGLGDRCVDHAMDLFRGMKGLGKSWGSQVCITVAEHEDLMHAAAEAGVNTFYIGFESVEAESLRSMDKKVNLRPSIRNYRETIRKIHDHGIGIIGGFILGSDTDTKDSFHRLVEFVHETEIDGCQFTIMTPFPGTRFYEQMQREGRLLYTNYPADWARYSAYEAVIEPRGMTIDELRRGRRLVYDATSTMGRSFSRGVRTLVNTRSLTNAFTNFFWNYYNYSAIEGLRY